MIFYKQGYKDKKKKMKKINRANIFL